MPINLVLITLVGYALRLPMIDRFSFREDEAIYSFWALYGWHQDPFFLSVWPDKPPPFLWLLGAAYSLFGIEAASGRWVNIAASTLTIPIVAVTARRLWGDRAALIAALVVALSPFAISFSPTAFVDPVLVLAGSLTLCMTVFARPLAAGFWLGAAIMTKQQGLFYVPLIAAMLIGNNIESRRSRYQRDCQVNEVSHADSVTYGYSLFLGGLAMAVLPVILWDSRRWATAPSPWDLSVRNYGRLTVVPPEEWPRRLLEWWPILWQITASPATWIVLALGLVSAVIMVGYRRMMQGTIDLRSTGPAAIIGLWAAGYLLLHLVSTIQVWDRYLLPLAPPLALLCGWAASTFPLPTSPWIRRGAVGMIALLLALPAWQAAGGALPVGSDHGDYTGLDDAVDWIEQQAGPPQQPTVLYHDVLGWQLQFYLYSGIGRDGFTLRWFPSSTYLVDNAEKTPHVRKFYIQPDWASHPDLAGRLNMRSLSLANRFRSGHFSVYEVVDKHASACEWCVCTQDGGKLYAETGWQELNLDHSWQTTRRASSCDSSLH